MKKKYQLWIEKREEIVQHYRLSAEEIQAKEISLPALELQANELEQQIAVAINKKPEVKVSKKTDWLE